MRPLQQKLGWIQGSNSAESYTVKPIQTWHHFSAGSDKAIKKITPNHKKEKKNHWVHIVPWKSEPWSFLHTCSPSLSFPNIGPCFPRLSFTQWDTSTALARVIRGHHAPTSGRTDSLVFGGYGLFNTTSERSRQPRQKAPARAPLPKVATFPPNTFRALPHWSPYNHHSLRAERVSPPRWPTAKQRGQASEEGRGALRPPATLREDARVSRCLAWRAPSVRVALWKRLATEEPSRHRLYRNQTTEALQGEAPAGWLPPRSEKLFPPLTGWVNAPKQSGVAPPSGSAPRSPGQRRGAAWGASLLPAHSKY